MTMNDPELLQHLFDELHALSLLVCHGETDLREIPTNAKLRWNRDNARDKMRELASGIRTWSGALVLLRRKMDTLHRVGSIEYSLKGVPIGFTSPSRTELMVADEHGGGHALHVDHEMSRERVEAWLESIPGARPAPSQIKAHAEKDAQKTDKSHEILGALYAAAAKHHPAPAKPSELPCPKCWSKDINRTWLNKGSVYRAEEGSPLEKSKLLRRDGMYDVKAKEEVIVHHCRTCQYAWATAVTL